MSEEGRSYLPLAELKEIFPTHKELSKALGEIKEEIQQNREAMLSQQKDNLLEMTKLRDEIKAIVQRVKTGPQIGLWTLGKVTGTILLNGTVLAVIWNLVTHGHP